MAGTIPSPHDFPPPTGRVVLEAGPWEVLLDGSPLTPSRPGIAGDQGWLDGVRVVDVDRCDGGLLHVLERPRLIGAGDVVDVRLDGDRRRRLALTHLAAVLTAARLMHEGVEIIDVEIVAGLAWLDVDRSPIGLSLDGDVDDDVIVTERRPYGCERQIVSVGRTPVSTFLAPLATRARDLAGTSITSRRSTAEPFSTIRIAVPGGADRWWR